MRCRYIIQGVTEEGRKFRPSDWIDRIASMMASYGSSQRLVFSNLLHPELYEGQRCLIIDMDLEQENLSMFEYVMNFVKANNLKMIQLCDIDNSKLGA